MNITAKTLADAIALCHMVTGAYVNGSPITERQMCLAADIQANLSLALDGIKIEVADEVQA